MDDQQTISMADTTTKDTNESLPSHTDNNPAAMRKTLASGRSFSASAGSVSSRGLTSRLNDALHSLNASIAAAAQRTSTRTSPAAHLGSLHMTVNTTVLEQDAAETNDLARPSARTRCIHFSIFPYIHASAMRKEGSAVAGDSTSAASETTSAALPDAAERIATSPEARRTVLSIPHDDTCALCNETIDILEHWRNLLKQSREQMEHYQDLERAAESKAERLAKENERLNELTVALEDRIDKQSDEILSLKTDIQSLSSKLVQEVEQRAEVQVERDRISEELEELTRSLFEQANGMVADEAKRRYALEQSQVLLHSELNKTKNKLESERLEVLMLRKRLSSVSVASLRSTETLTGSPLVPRPGRARTVTAASSGNKGSSVASESADARTFGADSITAIYCTELLAEWSALPVNDSFATLDVDFLPDHRLFDSFVGFLDKVTTIPLNKLFSAHPFTKAIYDEHVEPTGRLPRIACKKLMEAITNGTLYMQFVSEEEHRDSGNAERGLTPTGGSPTTTDAPILSARSASPQRQQFWSALTGSASTGGRFQCGACGREHECKYQLILNAPPASANTHRGSPLRQLARHATTSSAASSVSSSLGRLDSSSQNGGTPIWIDTWCRDRVLSIWELVVFLHRLYRRQSEQPQAEDGQEQPTTEEPREVVALDEAEVKQLYVEFLRHLKQMFYARVGVLSYFKQVEDQLRELENAYKDQESEPVEHSKE